MGVLYHIAGMARRIRVQPRSEAAWPTVRRQPKVAECGDRHAKPRSALTGPDSEQTPFPKKTGLQKLSCFLVVGVTHYMKSLEQLRSRQSVDVLRTPISKFNITSWLWNKDW